MLPHTASTAAALWKKEGMVKNWYRGKNRKSCCGMRVISKKEDPSKCRKDCKAPGLKFIWVSEKEKEVVVDAETEPETQGLTRG